VLLVIIVIIVDAIVTQCSSFTHVNIVYFCVYMWVLVTKILEIVS